MNNRGIWKEVLAGLIIGLFILVIFLVASGKMKDVIGAIATSIQNLFGYRG